MSDEGLRRRVHEALARDPLPGGAPWERRVRLREQVARLVAAEASPGHAAALARDIADAIAGLGPLEPLLHDPAVTEVMVNAPDEVWVERDGMLERVPVRFADAAAVAHLIERVVGPLGLRVDQSVPWVDARLPDGSRVHAIVPPLAVRGPALTIRRPAPTPPSLDELAARGSVDPPALHALRDAVATRRNLIVSGASGAGKTTLLRALAAEVPAAERVITIEDSAELNLRRGNLVVLEGRPANVEGVGRVTIRDLVRNALRMRPDRLVIGEVRGAEALDMLQAMNTGHDGSMSTAHANGPADLLVRLEAMATAPDAPPGAVLRRMIEAALHLVVHVERAPDGARRVGAICAVRPGPSVEAIA